MTDKKVEIAPGVTAEIVDEAEAEEAAAVICMRVEDMPNPLFDDDEIGECSLCHEPIRYRPHVPKKPPKICSRCMIEAMQNRVQ